MAELEFDHLVLRYCRQIIMKTMDHVRGAMRGENRLHLKRAVADSAATQIGANLTKAVDRDAEDLILEALQQKFLKLPGVTAYTVFSEELGIKTFPERASESDADLVVFIDPIDGTEFIEALQGGWSLIAVTIVGRMRFSPRWRGHFSGSKSTGPRRAAIPRGWISSPIPGSGWMAGRRRRPASKARGSTYSPPRWNATRLWPIKPP